MLTATGIRTQTLRENGRKLLRRDGRQVLLIASGDRLFAIANRCPHEGYPLSEGTLGPDCVLTCNWHNWKFDLANGEALVGRDPVRTYAIADRDGEIFIDLADPPAEAQRQRALKGLDVAILDTDLPRMAREVARLEQAGFDAREALVHGFVLRNACLENGMTHAHAAAADWLALAARAKRPEQRLSAMLEPLFHIGWDSMGAIAFPYASGIAQWSPDHFLQAVEAEDEPAAVARIRGAFAENVSYAQLRPVLAQAALAHYADFGHCAIYAFKTGQLIERLGDEMRETALLALVRMLVRSTREERVPEFRGYARALTEWERGGSAPANASDFIGHSIDAALTRTLASSRRPTGELFDALLGAAAWNLAHFDTDIEFATGNPIADNISWLDFTHALTFANACRHLCAERPDLWPAALLQVALFVGRNRKYVRREEDVSRWSVPDRRSFLEHEMTALYDHGVVEPIIACHRLKVLFALEDEQTCRPEAPWLDDMFAGVNRYLHAPVKRHHSLRTAAQALDFVAREA
jgi:nitrite reductase/ring-hydroxylating ferredoxin subunit